MTQRIDRDEARQLLAQGWRKAALARRYGVSRAAITKALPGAKLPPGPGSSAPRREVPPPDHQPSPADLLAQLGQVRADLAQQLAHDGRLEARPDLVAVNVVGDWTAVERMQRLAREKAVLERVWGRPVAFTWP